jgi:hypothetical protein
MARSSYIHTYIPGVFLGVKVKADNLIAFCEPIV